MSAVLCRFLTLLIVVIGCSKPSEMPAPCAKHINRDELLSACVPLGWAMQDTSYWIRRRTRVFALAKNELASDTTSDFWMEEWQARRGSGRPWQIDLAERLPPGAAIVLFSHFEGGPLMICNFSRDTVGDTLASVVDTLRMDFSKTWPVRLTFSKWGEDWEIDVVARNVTNADTLAIRSLLRSIVFESKPVITEGQAVQLAYQELPLEVRKSADPCRFRNFSVSVSETGGTFETLFKPCRGCGCDPEPDEAIEGEWRYRVHANGSVEKVWL